ncbi:MAG: NosD domain-containing protein [Candidatus Thermoplasmatota archaeon]|nr:NosD domain-containing protein [Candidatus Thermoplasmatota archaeon]MDP7266363.1 NosD domain-containing protein [Candidatus Thermoplasmatota archaeon]
MKSPVVIMIILFILLQAFMGVLSQMDSQKRDSILSEPKMNDRTCDYLQGNREDPQINSEGSWYDDFTDDSKVFSKENVTINDGSVVLEDNEIIPNMQTKGLWHFNEGIGNVAQDSSGNNNPGTLNNMNNNDWVNGILGTSLDFDGSNDHLSAQHSNSSYGIVLASNHSRIRDCNSTGNVIGIVLGGARNSKISGCRSDQNYGAGLYMTDSYMNIISRSTFDWNGEVGISLYYSGANLFTNGSSSSNNGYGFYAYWLSNGNQMDNFTLLGNNKSGIYLFDSYYNTVENCNSSLNGGDGFYLMTSGSLISNCISFNNDEKGFNLYHTDTTAISNCTIRGNTEEGISLKYSSDNIITGNLIINNELGIKVILKSNLNLFHSNVFIHNFARVQGSDDGVNYWNTSQRGNYWSDLSGLDEDGNGIVDVAYEIDGDAGAKDHLPLGELPLNYIPQYVEFIPPPEEIPEPDSDGDGWNDSYENSSGSNPHDISSTPLDWDGDGVKNDEDEYPNDASKWERYGSDQNVILITIVIVFVLLLVVIVCLGLMKIRDEPNEETRLQVIACIRNKPGARYRDIKNELGISGWHLSYHLEHLSAERILVSRDINGEKLWFISEDD